MARCSKNIFYIHGSGHRTAAQIGYMSTRPYVFIGSSSEGLSVASALKENLDHDADAVVWNQNAFELGTTYLESLLKQLHKADFAILVLTQDDITISRKQRTTSPRDNVLFELGLAIGTIGRERCYFVYDNAKDFKLPSDLSGVNGAPYWVQASGNLTASLGTAAFKIREMIGHLGHRFKLQPAAIHAYGELFAFCERVEGWWWERVKPDAVTAISFVHLYLDRPSLTLKLKAQSFDTTGNYTAFWASDAVSINYKERKILYYWTGRIRASPSEPFEGFGEISLFEKEGAFKEGVGVFTNINVTDIRSISKKSFELRRSTREEVAVMDANNKKKIASLVAAKIENML